jgi:hypothetical protein
MKTAEDTLERTEAPVDQKEQPQQNQLAIIPIDWPESADQLKAPRSTDLVAECRRMTHEHWAEFKLYWQDAEKGKNSTYGSFEMAQAALTFMAKQIAAKGGYPVIGDAKEADVLRGMRNALKAEANIKATDLKKNAIAFNVDIRRRLAKP